MLWFSQLGKPMRGDDGEGEVITQRCNHTEVCTHIEITDVPVSEFHFAADAIRKPDGAAATVQR